MQRTLALVLLLAPAVTLVAADRPHFESHPVDRAITIDGSFDDWTGSRGALEPFGKDSVSIQALNDGTFLYLRLSASDPAVRSQIVRRGLTVWFDPKGGTKKFFGVRYPVIENPTADAGIGGYRFGGRRQPGAGGQGSGSSGTGSAGAQPDDSEQPPDRVDLLGPGKNDEVSLTREHLQGVEVAFKVQQGILQYEMKVPLAKTTDTPYAIGTASGATIGIGLETPRPEQRMYGGESGGYGGGGMGGGGFGGPGGFGHGGGMGRRPGGGFDAPAKPLKGWGLIALAGQAS